MNVSLMTRQLHAGAVEHAVALESGPAARAQARLERCHPHVFVVDGSTRGLGYVTLGVSQAGYDCLLAEFGGEVPEL